MAKEGGKGFDNNSSHKRRTKENRVLTDAFSLHMTCMVTYITIKVFKKFIPFLSKEKQKITTGNCKKDKEILCF